MSPRRDAADDPGAATNRTPAKLTAPLPTLAAARDRIRALRAGGSKVAMTVLVRGGT
jgi:hypothetical protein